MLPRRDLVAVLVAMVGLTAISWVYLVWMSTEMSSPNAACMIPGSGGGLLCGIGGLMGLQSVDKAGETVSGGWSAGYFFMMLTMWVVMMVGMMVPSATPMAMMYAGIARKSVSQQRPIAGTYVFVLGYLIMWALFSLGATLAQWGLDAAALLSPQMVVTSPWLGAGLLIMAGIYQLTPAKQACLTHCRMPAHFIARHWRDGTLGAVRMGMHHGAYCLGCCWVLMLLLFFGGVMSLFWIVLITLFVLLEKLLPCGGAGGRYCGAIMVGIGAGLMIMLMV